MKQTEKQNGEAKAGTFTFKTKLGNGQQFEIVLNPMDKDTFTACAKLVRMGKNLDATLTAMRALKVSGDDVALLEQAGNFQSLVAAEQAFMDMTEPIEYDLKKN